MNRKFQSSALRAARKNVGQRRRSHSGEYDCEQIEERDRPVIDKVDDQQ